MDGVTHLPTSAQMPPLAPLARPIQNLDQPYSDSAAPDWIGKSQTLWFRLAAFLPAVAATCALIFAFGDWFAMDGFVPLEAGIIALVAFTFFWISLSVSTAVLGVATLYAARPSDMPKALAPALDVALLVPIYNEDPIDVFGNAAAMMAGLRAAERRSHFHIFILSDTRDDEIAAKELRAFEALRDSYPGQAFYRRRLDNTDRKVGNLANWVERHGGAYDAMLVLDADSLMSGGAITALTDALARDPAAGLIQSFPTLFGAKTVFGRVQQFSNRIYGAALAEGLAKWTDRDGNYWGHNAIIRTSAFASCAGLPRLKSRKGPGRLILSHDFIEAGLLRRAGWSVRFLPQVDGSYEEVPPTLIDYVIRDRRWCQGNLQHLGLLRSRGFHAVSRFHLISGAMGYLTSPAWFALLLVWALIGNGVETNTLTYFSGYDSQVSWPSMSTGNAFLFLGFMYAMLLAPKLMSAAAAHRAGIVMRDVGGLGQFLLSVIIEITLSIAYAPILMVQQTGAVVRTLIGARAVWNPQQRQGKHYSLGVMIKFHAFETLIGVLLVAGMMQGLVTLWLLPIAVSLVLAIPLSALSGINLSNRRWSSRQMGTPEHLNAPQIIRTAMIERRRFAELINRPVPIAAE